MARSARGPRHVRGPRAAEREGRLRPRPALRGGVCSVLCPSRTSREGAGCTGGRCSPQPLPRPLPGPPAPPEASPHSTRWAAGLGGPWPRSSKHVGAGERIELSEMWRCGVEMRVDERCHIQGEPPAGGGPPMGSPGLQKGPPDGKGEPPGAARSPGGTGPSIRSQQASSKSVYLLKTNNIRFKG